MYSRIEIENFKSLKKVIVDPQLITLFVGPNSSGKSSILQVLTLLRQSIGQQALQTRGPIINLGDCADLISRGSNTMSLMIGGAIEAWKDLETMRAGRMLYNMFWFFGAQGNVNDIRAVVGSEQFELMGSWVRGEKVSAKSVTVADFEFSYQSTPNIGFPFAITSPAGSGDKASVWRDLQTTATAVQRQLELTFSVPPFRGQDLPEYSLKPTPELQLTSTSGSVEQASGLASTIAYRRELESKISDWIERITEVRVSSELVPGPRVTVRAHPKKLRIRPNIVNEGYGSNQLVHLMGQIALAPEGSSICIDDPEIHLHPKAQAELAELLVEIAKDERKQLLITTHSEHMLFRFLTNVAEKRLKPRELAIYYCDKNTQGWTSAKKLEVDEKGTIEEGLPGFFEADIGEFRKYMEALSGKPKQ